MKDSLLKNNFPELIKEWDFERNKDIDLEKIKCGSGKMVWWICEKGHNWQYIVNNRTRGFSCPVCKGRKRELLKDKYPEIIKEWNYEKNIGTNIEKVTYGSRKKVWWICENDHEWQAVINNRSHGTGCPFCAGKSGELFKERHPELLKEWNYERNKSVNLQIITFGSNKKVWWKCGKQHHWKTTINHRSKGSGCPFCAREKRKLHE